jgi:hypothetical protein
MALLTAAVLLAQEQPVEIDPAVEGKKVIIGMLITGLVFCAVIALGQASKWLSHRREARRPRPY